MKKIFLSIACLILADRGLANQIQDSVSSSLVKAVLTNPKTTIFDNERRSKSMVFVLDHFIPWDSVSFGYPKERLPKNKKERVKRLNSEYDVYHLLYVFAPFETDSIYTESEKDFMISEATVTQAYPLTIEVKSYKALDTQKKRPLNFYGFSCPIFSPSGNKAIIRKYVFHRLSGEKQYSYSTITLHYKLTKDNNWKLVFIGSVVL